jgi:hypothetical protein
MEDCIRKTENEIWCQNSNHYYLSASDTIRQVEEMNTEIRYAVESVTKETLATIT